jgi:hypothetical protein
VLIDRHTLQQSKSFRMVSYEQLVRLGITACQEFTEHGGSCRRSADDSTTAQDLSYLLLCSGATVCVHKPPLPPSVVPDGRSFPQGGIEVLAVSNLPIAGV